MTTLFAALLYVATAVLVGGLAYRIRDYARTPAPLKIPTTPAPTTTGGVALRLLREVALFESLFRSNLWTWAFGWLFHAGLALVLLRHLRYFVEPMWVWVAFLQPFGVYGGIAMAAGLGGLWARRFLVGFVGLAVDFDGGHGVLRGRIKNRWRQSQDWQFLCAATRSTKPS